MPDHGTAEEPLDPRRPIVDPHHHVWPELSHAVATSYSLEDLERDITQGHNVVSTVYVECSSRYRTSGPAELRPVGETEYVISLQSTTNAFEGIVGFADMELGTNVGAVLREHKRVAGSRFKGVRHSVAWHPDPGVANTAGHPYEHQLRNTSFREGVAQVGREGLVFETWLYFNQLPELAELATELSDVPIVVNHMGGPLVSGPYRGRRPEMLEQWRAGLEQIATCPNVYLKVGGIGFRPFVSHELRGAPRSSAEIAAHWRPEILFAIRTLGADRCMFESDFPVDSYLCDYSTLWNVFQRIATDLRPNEQDALFSGTATRVYSLAAQPRAG